MSVRTTTKYLILLLLTGCSPSFSLLGKEQGKLAAGITLPNQPMECRKQYAHAKISVGDDPVVALKRERQIVVSANQTIRLCADFNDSVKTNFEKDS
jgi:hypothetical protein